MLIKRWSSHHKKTLNVLAVLKYSIKFLFEIKKIFEKNYIFFVNSSDFLLALTCANTRVLFTGSNGKSRRKSCVYLWFGMFVWAAVGCMTWDGIVRNKNRYRKENSKTQIHVFLEFEKNSTVAALIVVCIHSSCLLAFVFYDEEHHMLRFADRAQWSQGP